jgi:hypothetical protein
MSEHPFQGWVDKMVMYSNVLACGVRMANQSVAIKTFDESFPEARLKELLQCLTEAAFTLRNSQLGGSRICWVFENGQLQVARRKDGALAVLVMSKDPNAASAVDELLGEFLDFVCPVPERPGLNVPDAAEALAPPDSDGVQQQ